ncbi:MAG: DNA repair protein RadC [Bacteroidales bacterium]|nr:DNA repair protein RadC [Bacteroidales bacterium]
MKEWSLDERPREKMLHRGAASLSNAELLAIFIGSGVPGTNAVDVGQELLSSVGGRLSGLYGLPAGKLMEHKGIGEARAVAIAAAMELGRRYMAEESAPGESVHDPEQVFRMMLPVLKGLRHEECWILYLNRANVVTGREKLTTGTAESTLIDSRHVLRRVIEQQAKGVILVHNHPSGSPLPGEADIRETRKLQLALKTFDVLLLDHVIIADGAYYSFEGERVVRKGL